MNMKRNRFQTYVFDTEFATREDQSHRNVLGPDYKGGAAVAWQDGHAMRERDALLDFVRNIRDGEFLGDEAKEAERLMESLNVG